MHSNKNNTPQGETMNHLRSNSVARAIVVAALLVAASAAFAGDKKYDPGATGARSNS
jgi:hypothetical protein